MFGSLAHFSLGSRTKRSPIALGASGASKEPAGNASYICADKYLFDRSQVTGLFDRVVSLTDLLPSGDCSGPDARRGPPQVHRRSIRRDQRGPHAGFLETSRRLANRQAVCFDGGKQRDDGSSALLTVGAVACKAEQRRGFQTVARLLAEAASMNFGERPGLGHCGFFSGVQLR